MSSPVLERSKSAPTLLTAAQRTMLAQVGACNAHLTSDENMAINELRLHKPRLPKEPLIYSIFRPGNALEALIYLGATAGF
ncbi:hypothetical protein AL065_04665 [Pseudomonas amygdali pv. ulmi]|nr:hypothetical protein AL065_04665 [Pseudomonas amygdali pv. ulmi]